jgi:lipid-A-disaccharide synthase
MKDFKIFIVAGDPSGDTHAATVVTALHAHCAQSQTALHCHGVGGDAMARAGVKLLDNQAHMGRVGLGAITGIPHHYLLGKRIIAHLKQFKPNVVLLVDYGGFNLRLATALKSNGIGPIHYFIPPQLWASRPQRMRQIQASIDHVYCIFPFEEALYQAAGVSVTYVGHPLSGTLPAPVSKTDFCSRHGLDADRPIVGLFAGSRAMEIKYLLGPLCQATQALTQRCQQEGLPKPQFVLAKATSMDLPQRQAWFSRQLQQAQQHSPIAKQMTVVTGQTHALMSVAMAGWVASGTATLEAALYGMPTVLIYKGHWLAYVLVKRLLKLPYIGLPNILAYKQASTQVPIPLPVIPELWQNAVAPKAMTDVLLPLLSHSAIRMAMVNAMGLLQTTLGMPGVVNKTPCSQIVASQLLML